MESKAIQTAEEFLYVIGIYDNILYDPRNKNGIHEIKLSELLHEYAVLFAKQHMNKQIEAIKESVEQACIDMNLVTTEINIILDSIENAYSENNIK